VEKQAIYSRNAKTNPLRLAAAICINEPITGTMARRAPSRKMQKQTHYLQQRNGFFRWRGGIRSTLICAACLSQSQERHHAAPPLPWKDAGEEERWQKRTHRMAATSHQSEKTNPL